MSTLLLPPVIDVRITGRCDLRCPFCFGPRHEIRDTDIGRTVALLEQVSQLGVRQIVVTGGEPTLVPELPKLLTAAKRIGLTVVLSTNGINFLRRMDELAPFIDWLGLPLDSDDSKMNAALRVGVKDHFAAVRSVMHSIRLRYPQVQIKLGTVVTRTNKDCVARIPTLICESALYRPNVWKVYQVAYSGYGADNRAQLELSDTEFADVERDCEQNARAEGLPVVFYRRERRVGSYLFLEPNGDASVVAARGDIVIGNFFQDIDAVLRRWSEFANLDRVTANFQETYPDAIQPN